MCYRSFEHVFLTSCFYETESLGLQGSSVKVLPEIETHPNCFCFVELFIIMLNY